MGIRFFCPNGHKLNVKAFQAGRRGICPYCGAGVEIPAQSTCRPGKKRRSPRMSRPDGPLEALIPTSPPTPLAMPGPADAPPPQQAQFPVSPLNSLPMATPLAAPLAAASAPRNSPILLRTAAQPTNPAASRPVVAAHPNVAGMMQPLPAAAGSGRAALQPPAPPGAAPDPLTEAPNAVWYVRPPAGGQYGPASSPTMRGWIDEGRVSADSLVWREGWRDWKEAAEIFPQLAVANDPMAKLNELLESGAAKHFPRGAAPASLRRPAGEAHPVDPDWGPVRRGDRAGHLLDCHFDASREQPADSEPDKSKPESSAGTETSWVPLPAAATV